MPIRFRCAYCDQLMGISRRKVGTVVRCPKCSGQVVVPDVLETPDDADVPATDHPAAMEDPAIEKLLAGAAKGAAGLSKRKRSRTRMEIDVEPLEPGPIVPAVSPPMPVAPAAALRSESAAAEAEDTPLIVRTPSGWVVTVSTGVAVGMAVALALFVGLGVLVGYLLGRSTPE